jgi:hypothetical protein
MRAKYGFPNLKRTPYRKSRTATDIDWVIGAVKKRTNAKAIYAILLYFWKTSQSPSFDFEALITDTGDHTSKNKHPANAVTFRKGIYVRKLPYRNRKLCQPFMQIANRGISFSTNLLILNTSSEIELK